MSGDLLDPLTTLLLLAAFESGSFDFCAKSNNVFLSSNGHP